MTAAAAPTHADLYHRTEAPDGSGRLQLVATFKVSCPGSGPGVAPDFAPHLGRDIVAAIRRASAAPRWHERLGPAAILQQGPFRPSGPGDVVVLQGAGRAEAFLLGPGAGPGTCAPIPLATVEAMAATAGCYVVERVGGLKQAGQVASSYVVAGDGTIRAFDGFPAAKHLAEDLNAAAEDGSFFRAVPQPEW